MCGGRHRSRKRIGLVDSMRDSQHMPRAAVVCDRAHEKSQPTTNRDRHSTDRRPAPATHGLEHSPLGDDGNSDGRIVERTHDLEDRLVVAPGLHRECTLRGRRWHRSCVQASRNAAAQAKPIEPGGRQHQRVRLPGIKTAQSRVDVAVQRDHVEVGSQRTQKAGAARAVRTHLRAHSEVVERTHYVARDQRVSRIRSLGIGRDHELRIVLEREVFGAVHGEVDLTGDERALEGRHEDALPDRRVRRPQVTVGNDCLHLDLNPAGAQARGHELALHKREARTAGAQAKPFSRSHHPLTSLAAPPPRAPRPRQRRRRRASPACQSPPGRQVGRSDPAAPKQTAGSEGSHWQ